MAITLKNNIKYRTPAFNPFFLVLDSTNKTETGFGYIVDIYNAGTTTFQRRLRVQPNPLNSNYGVIDLKQYFADRLSGDPMTINFSAACENTQQQHRTDIKLGEEIQYSWSFYDNFYSSVAGFENNVGFTSHTQHSYSVGDYIYITQQAGCTYDAYNGVMQVVNVPNNYSVIVNYQFLGSTTVESGTTRYNDYRKTVSSGLTNYSSILAFDAAFEDFNTMAWTSYTENPQILSVLNDFTGSTAYTVRLTNNGFLNVACKNSSDINKIYVGNDGSEVELNKTAPSSTTNFIYRFPFTPASINSNLGYDFISAGTPSYSVRITSNSGTTLNKHYFYINEACTPNGNVELLFEDLLGSYIPFNFNFIINESVNIERKTYKKSIEYGLNNGNYIYNPQSQTNKIYSINNKETISIHTGYIDETLVSVIEQLLLSKNIYWNKENAGVYLPVTITDSSFIRKTSLRNSLIDYTITFELSNNRPINI